MDWYAPVVVPAAAPVTASATVSAAGITRGLHFWLAQIVLLIAAFAICRAFFVKTNRPRAGWAAGTFLLTGLFWFTGMLLPWDQLNFWLAPLFRPPTGLLTVYWLHALVLPVLLLAVLIIYARRLEKHTP